MVQDRSYLKTNTNLQKIITSEITLNDVITARKEQFKLLLMFCLL